MRHKNYGLCVRAAWAIALVGIGASALAQSFLPDGDGWFYWRIDAVADAPTRCCFDWRDGDAVPRQCNLDRRRGGFGSMADKSSRAEHAWVYAKRRDGEIVAVSSFSPDCRIKTESPAIEVEDVPADQSVRWLTQLALADHGLADDAVGAIAFHADPAGRRALTSLAQGTAAIRVRKSAVFYLGQMHAKATRDVLTQVLFSDSSTAMREHAAFSVSESDLDDRADLLARLAQEDPDPSVRGKAWFWLAQTADAKTEAAIVAALKHERATNVRHEAIFALAQLPDERAVKALISVVENAAAPLSDRKQALFWLAEGESSTGLDYLSQMLAQ